MYFGRIDETYTVCWGKKFLKIVLLGRKKLNMMNKVMLTH